MPPMLCMNATLVTATKCEKSVRNLEVMSLITGWKNAIGGQHELVEVAMLLI